jgi:dTDP-4-amino-4,6-dideoxygalactose transaminase
MDLDDLERKLSPTTKIIYLVHWGGYPVDLDRVKRIQDKCYKLYGFKPAVIEDCAHAFGSKYKNIPIGSYGNYSTFSFQAIKHLTSVDGGILICPHEKQYKRARVLRWYGIDRDDNRKDFRCEADIPEWGYKFHMNDVNASIGLSNLKEVDKEVISKHKANAKYYNEQLKNVNGVTLLENKEGYDSAYWIYTLKVERQNDFMEMMKNQGIMVSRVHERNDKHTCVKEFRSSLPNLDKVVKEMICIPVGWWVTNEQREYIVKSIKQGW